MRSFNPSTGLNDRWAGAEAGKGCQNLVSIPRLGLMIVGRLVLLRKPTFKHCFNPSTGLNDRWAITLCSLTITGSTVSIPRLG